MNKKFACRDIYLFKVQYNILDFVSGLESWEENTQ